MSRTLSPVQQLVDATHRGVLGVLLAVVALVTFGYGANVLTTATGATPATTLVLGGLSLLVALAATGWILSLFLQGLRGA